MGILYWHKPTFVISDIDIFEVFPFLLDLSPNTLTFTEVKSKTNYGRSPHTPVIMTLPVTIRNKSYGRTLFKITTPDYFNQS